jgi:cytochrome d ubiquinol oxidase subunit I
MDAVLLSRIQFAATALYHYLFVPLSVGIGLVLAILLTRAYKSKRPEDDALAAFWTRIFAATFAVGVATGITMEFSFGTNWADYSRFVGNIFGAPLAAEALFAFFMESVFLGVVLFGKKKVGPKFYLVSGWLVWVGSCLSALWIIIANSWMQTPAGYEVTTTDSGAQIATMTNFFEAALNHSTLQRYFHVIVALLLAGAMCAIAVGAYYKLKKRETSFAQTLIRIGSIIGIVCMFGMVLAGHQQAVEVAEQQPAKLAALEGQWEDGPVEMSLFGWVDEENQVTYTIGIPGLTSFLASGSFDTEYPGINDFDQDYQTGNVNAIYQLYHFMLYFFGLVALIAILGLVLSSKKFAQSKAATNKWLLRIMTLGPLAALAAIECGWCVAELGRQPWIVYGELKTADAVSLSVDSWMLVITLVLFAVIYLLIYGLWLRSVAKTLKAGPSSFMETSIKPTQDDKKGVWE